MGEERAPELYIVTEVWVAALTIVAFILLSAGWVLSEMGGTLGAVALTGGAILSLSKAIATNSRGYNRVLWSLLDTPEYQPLSERDRDEGAGD